MTFGKKLKKIRIERNLSQDELANILGTSKQVISRYETEQRTPKVTVAQEYAKKLGLSLKYLIDDSYDNAKDCTDVVDGNVRQDHVNDPDLRRIERARKSMSETEKNNMMIMLQAAFSNYFSDDYVDDEEDDE